MTTTNAAPGDLSGLLEVPMSGDLLTTLRVEPGRLGRLLNAAALWTSPDLPLPSVQAIVVRVETERGADWTTTTIRAVGTDRYRLLDVRATLGSHESISGDPISHDLWIPAPIARGLAKELRAIRWPRYAKAPEQRVVELQFTRERPGQPTSTSLPAPFDALCLRAGLLSINLDNCSCWPVGVAARGEEAGEVATGVMRTADRLADAKPVTTGEPWTLNATLIADLGKIAPCAKAQYIRPWTFAPVRNGRDGLAIRATPAYSPHPTDPPVDLDAVGHIMPIRSAS